ncbi:MAG: 4Fe-4S dicluster domain-containing protein [Chloroflexota bacterium]|nr:MAG: 4Fe-4S dicluster domain-containing protein [Chloroflexota bacterium]
MTVALSNVPGGKVSPPPPHRPAETPPYTPLAIASDRCKGCELCIGACPHGVLALDVGVVNPLGYHPIRLIDAAGCTSCALCARVCPDAVFTVFAPRKGA